MALNDTEFVDILGSPTVVASPALRAVLRSAQRAAMLPAAVLVVGETGSGKEHVGRANHHFSRRSSGPWVDVNCAAIPDHLLESELFGYEKGAFSGANAVKPGLVELADKGTLFLDEIGELAPTLQAKMLRILDRVPYYRLGGVRKINPDVRLVAATNQDLPTLMSKGEFRRDLYHRLSQITIQVPPLRQRIEDIQPLAEYFLSSARPGARLAPSAIELLQRQPWPGNARELLNSIMGALMETDSDLLEAAHFSFSPVADLPAAPSPGAHTPLCDIEKESILAALRHSHGNQKQAAKELRISTRTLYRKLKLYEAEQSGAASSSR